MSNYSNVATQQQSDERAAALQPVPVESHSNWLQRINFLRASYEYSHRLKYSLEAIPCRIDDKDSLIIARNLETQDTFAYEHIVRFAEKYDLKIVVDRRVSEQAVSEERRAA